MNIYSGATAICGVISIASSASASSIGIVGISVQIKKKRIDSL
jgi:hypothetical protein